MTTEYSENGQKMLVKKRLSYNEQTNCALHQNII